MWFELRSVGLEFLRTAPKVYVAECTIAAPPRAVWDAFTHPSTWRSWWPGVTSASYGNSPEPYGVGTFREARVSGQRYQETIVAWDEERRFAYRIDRATIPIAHAQLESTELRDEAGNGTRVRWTIACTPRLLMRLGAPFFPRIMNRMLVRAMANLEAYLERRSA